MLAGCCAVTSLAPPKRLGLPHLFCFFFFVYKPRNFLSVRALQRVLQKLKPAAKPVEKRQQSLPSHLKKNCFNLV